MQAILEFLGLRARPYKGFMIETYDQSAMVTMRIVALTKGTVYSPVSAGRTSPASSASIRKSSSRESLDSPRSPLSKPNTPNYGTNSPETSPRSTSSVSQNSGKPAPGYSLSFFNFATGVFSHCDNKPAQTPFARF